MVPGAERTGDGVVTIVFGMAIVQTPLALKGAIMFFTSFGTYSMIANLLNG